MSSYGAWDGGPPGAEAEYGEPPVPGAGPPVAAPAAPATDPWTGRRYDQHAAYVDYYGYGYPPAAYYPSDPGYASYVAPPPPPAPSPPTQPRRRSPEYSRRSRRDYSPSPPPRRARRSDSEDSEDSDRSYKRSPRGRRGERSPSRGSRRRSPSPPPPPPPRFARDRSPASRDPEPKYHSGRDSRVERRRDPTPPPRRRRESPPRSRKDRPSVSPPRSYARDRDRSLTPPKSYKYKSETPPRKPRDSSLTPPKSYARGGSVSSDKSDKSSSKSSARSPSPARRKKRSERRSFASSSDSESSASSRERSKAKRKEKSRRSESRSKSRSRRRSRSKSRRRSKSKDARKKRSVSRGSTPPMDGKGKARSRSRSSGGTPSDEEQRRGQFTVADRKRFWKMHKTRQETEPPRSPPKEVRPPPGAVETTTVDDLEYGVPPEVEGPNFAELLQTPDMAHLAQASSSKSKSGVPVIKNDGSFLEMFKKMQEATKKAEEAVKKPEIKKPTLPFIGKRRGGRVLKTGMVKKAKAIDEQTVDNTPKDAWSLYMQEVKKYRETSCEEERKTRPLVK